MISVGIEVRWHAISFAGFPVNSNSNGENELCPKVRIGQDDLPGEYQCIILSMHAF